jgi:hypothetical protein
MSNPTLFQKVMEGSCLRHFGWTLTEEDSSFVSCEIFLLHSSRSLTTLL